MFSGRHGETLRGQVHRSRKKMRTLSEKIQGRRRFNRPQTTICISIPTDLIPDLEDMAPMLGFSNAHALLRSYLSQGMRDDEARLTQPELVLMREAMEKHGIAEDVIAQTIADTLVKARQDRDRAAWLATPRTEEELRAAGEWRSEPGG